MLQMSSAMKDYVVMASDEAIGTMKDFLFDQTTWVVRWVVVDTGTWLTGREILVHPSAIGRVDHERRRMEASLTREQVADSPDIGRDRPVSRQMQADLYDHYGWDPLWGGALYGGGLYPGSLMGAGMGATGLAERDRPSRGFGRGRSDAGLADDEGDPGLRSMAEVTRYHVHATDGGIGHVEDLLLDTPGWSICYLVVDTSNWWMGRHVLISPHAIVAIDWAGRSVKLDITRARVEASPVWTPADLVDPAFEQRLDDHYG